MTPVGAILLGLGLGLRHATDADHVLIVSALLKRQSRPLQAAPVAAWGGLGHSVSVLAVGLLLVLLEIRLPQSLAVFAEGIAAAMLVGLGVWHLRRQQYTYLDYPQSSAPTVIPAGRAVVVGAVHGLAGSAGVALLAGAAIENRLLAASYLVLFGLGTVFGMMVLTAMLARPLAWANGHSGLSARVTRFAAAILSIGLGVYLLCNIELGRS